MKRTGTPPGDHRVVLAVDLGTGGPKVALVSLTGTILWVEHTPVSTRTDPDGGSTQDAEEWWQLITRSARTALATGPVPPEAVVAVSCTGQWASTVPVDAVGRPVGPCLMWSDTRGGPLTRKAVGGPVSGYHPVALARWIRISGGAPSTSGADPIGHMLHLEQRCPEVAAAARWYLEPVDYLAMRFTGVASASGASMAGSWLTDTRSPGSVRYDPYLIRASGVPMMKLPPLRPTGSVVGTVRAEVADALGLDAGVAVVAGTPDLHSGAVGSGAVLDYQTHLAISTTSWISCPVPTKKTDVLHQMATVPGISADRYLVANNQESGGGALAWLRDCLAGDGGVGASGGAPPGGAGGFDELTALAARAAAGSGGLIFTPWLGGERSPVDDRRARGGFHNLSLQTTRAELVRAVLEGVAYNSRWLADSVERFIGRPIGPIRAIGGGATSALWCSIYASVLGRTVEQVADPVHANLRGAALLAGMALGELERTDIGSLVPVAAIHHPDPEDRAAYDRLYAEFPKLYRAQRHLFSHLNRA
jgi:xylulokinase